MIQILRHSREHGMVFFELATEKKTASIAYFERDGRINVTCNNASHNAWRGPGRSFESWAEARGGYKSSDMKSMVDVARIETEKLTGLAPGTFLCEV